MIAFGSAIQGAEAYAKYAEPGVQRAAEADSEIFAFAAVEPIGRTYNLILDQAARRPDLEALVLLHPHTEIVDDELAVKVRAALSDPDVALLGCGGATGVKSIAWWEGSVVASRSIHRYGEFGGGELPAFSWTEPSLPPAEVEAVDGQLLVLSPWAVRNLRFDESLLYSFGFDVDFSLKVREAGRKVMVIDLQAVFHRSVELVRVLDLWAESHIKVAERWDDVLHPSTDGEEGWRLRARYAEADREAARAFAFSRSLTLDARVLELETELERKTASLSWRVTAPLRAVNRLRRSLRSPSPSARAEPHPWR
jgi:hypothetical protein